MRKDQVSDHPAIHPAVLSAFVRQGMGDQVPDVPSQYHCMEESK